MKYYPAVGLSKNKKMPFTEPESQLYMKPPFVGRKILEQIPRLERIAQMIEGQLHSSGELKIHMLEGEEEIIKLGSQLLKLAIDYDQRLMKGMTQKATLSALRQKRGDYTSKLLDALTGYLGVSPESEDYTDLSINEFNVGMAFAEDVRERHGELIVSKGQGLTYPMFTYLFSLAARKNFLKDTYIVITNDSWDTSKNTSMV